MKVSFLLAVTVMAIAANADDRSGSARDVAVCMQPTDDKRFHEAARVATTIFSDINVRIEWIFAKNCPFPEAIQVSLARLGPDQRGTGALAYAFPYEGTRIVVMGERVKAMSGPCRFHLALGYVLVHEITHVVHGIRRHSEAGIMKAQWTQQDYFQMLEGRLGFRAEDVERINQGLAFRAAREQKVNVATLN